MYGSYPEVAKNCIEVPRMTLSERLKQERQLVANRLNEIDSVLAALDANPQVKDVLDLLQKTRCL